MTGTPYDAQIEMTGIEANNVSIHSNRSEAFNYVSNNVFRIPAAGLKILIKPLESAISLKLADAEVTINSQICAFLIACFIVIKIPQINHIN